MHKKLITIVICLVILPFFASAGDDFDIKVYPAGKITGGQVKIDGKIDEAVWQKLPVAGGFTYFNRNEPVVVQTYFYAAYDNEYLYIAVRCTEPFSSKLVPVPAGRDSTDVFSGESLEIFIDPGHSHVFYYQIVASYGGCIYDSREMDSGWDSDIRVETSTKDGEWLLEAAVPWSDLEVISRETGAVPFVPREGTVLGVNICRNRRLGGPTEYMNWSQTTTGFHDPLHFGHFVLSAADRQPDLQSLEKELRKDNRHGLIVMSGSEGQVVEGYRKMAAASLSAVEEVLREAENLKSLIDQKNLPQIGEFIGRMTEEIKRTRKVFAEGNKDDLSFLGMINREISGVKSEIEKGLWTFKLAILLESI